MVRAARPRSIPLTLGIRPPVGTRADRPTPEDPLAPAARPAPRPFQASHFDVFTS